MPAPLQAKSVPQNGHVEAVQQAGPALYTYAHHDSVSEKQLHEALAAWQKQHEQQNTQLQEQILLQSQDIAKLRSQVIDLQAFRQKQQIQDQTATYIKSQMFPAANGHKMQIPQDCCAAAMACFLAIEEIRSDLKAEGQIISKQLDILSSFQHGISATAEPKFTMRPR